MWPEQQAHWLTMKSRFVLRTRVIAGGMIFAALFLGVRLYFVQIVHGDEFREEARSQYEAPRTEAADRGSIFFTDKNGKHMEAALMRASYRIAIKPSQLGDTHATYDALNSVTPIEYSRYETSTAKRDDPYEEIATRVPEDKAFAIQALGLPGVVIVREYWRFYPAQKLAAQTLGFVGFRGDERVGRYGLERYWEDVLKRSPNSHYSNFFAEIFSSVQAFATEQGEGDLVTTIEPVVEQHLEDSLKEINQVYRPKHVGGIIMDPKTGAIYAMAALPTFDPNEYNTVSDPAVYSNPLVESVYEFGSTVKALTMAAGLDAGVITPKTTYEDRGFVIKSGARISNYDGKARGVVPMQEVLSQSLNTGVSFIVDRLGHERFARYMRAFKLGEETGIDLPNEVPGILSALESKSDVDYASASFGQGFATTPLALTRALSALANDGVLPEPHVVDSIRYESGITKRVWREGVDHVISEEAADTVTTMLTTVVDEALLHGEIKNDHYQIAAKTGTAQIARPGGGYYTDRYLHSFFGYFPASDPKFIIFLYTVEPQGVEYASQSLARPFAELANFLLTYYDVPPDRTP